MRKGFAVLAIMLVGAACSSSTTGMGSGTPGADEVFLQGSAFNPTTRTVAAGTTVHWSNKDGITHNVTSSSVPVGAATFSSGSLGGSGSFQVTFTVPGTYQYFCSLHGTATTGMHATIVVN
jgi:plastocyanin